ncbi:molecular chaperone [Burkholderia contaminans]|uniref:Molecular chaperone n=1 Tax=Burkholderia contaminans TaxID=488447 RepID=A0A3N8PS02_9BURK|nr:fimbria/pilus periplasmic chaperone [Burkholderia contaminans]RQT14381.1 molecular chaperone [Burkholderia contaminans]
MKRSIIAALVAAGSLLSASMPSHAGISLSATRVVYAQKDKEGAVTVKNQSSDDVMIQSWLESQNDKQDDLPFAITPSLSRLNGGKQQILRIFYAGQGLPVDRESVFWLNVQEIPQKAKDDNTLQIAVRQRIKLFYRPTALAGQPAEAAKQLQWRWTVDGGKTQLEAVNDSPYFVSLAKASVHIGTRTYTVVTEMVPPKSSKRMAIKDFSGHVPASGTRVEFDSINDFGASDNNQAEIAR